MRFELDPELCPHLPPRPELDDLIGERAERAARWAAQHVPNTSGLTIEEHVVESSARDASVSMRVYLPEREREQLRPAVFYIHGGGWMLGSLEQVHGRCIELAQMLPAVVVSVGYRMAPEHPFPAPLDDCDDGLSWLMDHCADLAVDPAAIAVGGTSAGANLAVGLALRRRDDGDPLPCFQYLGAPVLDDRMSTWSASQFNDAPGLDADFLSRAWDAYLGPIRRGSDSVSPYAAPMRAVDLGGLPSTYISVMEYDPLRDEGIDFAVRLLRAGVHTELHLFPGSFHGSYQVSTAEISKVELAEAVSVLQRALSRALERSAARCENSPSDIGASTNRGAS